MSTAKVEIEITARTAQAVAGIQKVTTAAHKSAEATAKAADSLAQYVAAARKQNASDKAHAAHFTKAADAAGRNGDAMRRLSGSTAGVSAAFRGAALGAGAFVAAAGVAAAAAVEFANRSVELQGVFGALPFAIDKARTSTRGLISDFELAKSANQLVSLGVVKTSADFADLAESAQKLGSKLGMDTTRTLDSLAAALGRGSTEMLDNLGIVLKMEQAHDLYAKQLGKTTAQLSGTEKGEAFKVIAMQKIVEAANGITLSTDSAAHSVVRLGVELDNLKDRALGGERATISLQEGIALLDENTRKLIPDTARHGDSLRKVQSALRDAGVASEELTDAYRPYIAALEEVNAEQQRQALWTSRSNKTIKDGMLGLAAATKAINDYVAATAMTERGRDIERELALLGDDAKAHETINALLAEKAEITAKQLELEGKLSEAQAIRFAEELRVLTNLGASTRTTRTKRSGGRRKVTQSDEFLAELGESRRPAFERDDSREFEAERRAAEQSRIAGQYQRVGDIEREEMAAAEEERIKRLEETREAAEEAAQERHKAEMARLAEQQARYERVGAAVGGSVASLATTWLQAGDLSARGFGKALQSWGKAESIKMAGIAISESVQALVSLATLNIPGAAAHGAAAAAAGAAAASIAALVGVSGGFGATKQVKGYDGAAFGPGGEARTEDRQSATNSQTDTTPVSETAMQQSAAANAGGMKKGGGATYVFQPGSITTLGAIDDQSARRIAQGIKRVGDTGGRLTG